MTKHYDPRVVGRLPSYPEARQELTRRAIERARDAISAEGILSLRSFIRLGWSQLEPSRDFVDGWHIGAICEHLTAISSGQLLRLVINVPPGMMKSLLCSVFWNAWEWGPRAMPSLRYINFSYDTALSTRDTLRTRRLMESPWYRALWGHNFVMTSDQNTKTRFENSRTGFRIADYVGGGTGERGDRDVVDDPHDIRGGESETKRESALLWLSETLPTRLNDPERSAIVVIQQRVHEQDISGEILSKNLGYDLVMLPMEYEPWRCCYTRLPKPGQQSQKMRFLAETQQWVPDDWRPANSQEKLLLPKFEDAKPQDVYKWDPRTREGDLIFPKRFPRDVVERDKAAMGEYAVAGQFQQRPTVRGGSLIKRHWFEIVEAIPSDCQWVRRWDLASTKDGGAYTAGVLMGRSRSDKKFYVRDVIRQQLSGDDVRRLVKQTAAVDLMNCGRRNYSVWLPQDPGQAGKVQAQDYILMLVGYDVHCEIESGDKWTRAQPFAAQAQAGNVKLLSGPWNESYLNELAKFSLAARYKDQVDASSGAFGVLISYKQQTTVIGSVRGGW